MALKENEIVKEIEGFPEYLVSNLGRVWSKHSNKWLTPIKNTRGNHVRLYVNLGRKNRFYIHQLVANAFLPNPLKLPEIDHIDGDATNNKLENLRWVSHQENMKNETTRERLKKNGGDYVEIEEIATGRIFQGYQEASKATGMSKAGILLHTKNRVKEPRFRLTGKKGNFKHE